MVSDGILLKSLAEMGSFDAAKLWGDNALLLVKAHADQESALFQTPSSPTAAADDLILGATAVFVNEQTLNSYVSPEAAVIPILKSQRNPFDHAVIVGRARNNDIRLNHPTVSKVHAYLARSKSDPTLWKIQDANSTNGTWLLTGSGPMRVAPGEPARVPVGTELRFGTVDCLLLDAESFQAAAMYAIAAWRVLNKDKDVVSGDTVRLDETGQPL